MLHHAVEARVGSDAGDTAPLGSGSAVNLVDVGGKIVGGGIGNVAADPETADRCAQVHELLDLLRSESATDKYLNVPEACEVEAHSYLFN